MMNSLKTVLKNKFYFFIYNFINIIIYEKKYYNNCDC